MKKSLQDYRYYQKEADDAIDNELLIADKCIVKKFCGTGKSLLMRKCKSVQNKNLVVYVGQVPQVGTINFTVEQSASGSLAGPNAPYADGTYIKFGTPPPNTQKIYVFHGYDQ